MSVAAGANEGAQHGHSIPPLQIAAVALVVRNVERVTAFYRDAIGLEVLHRDPSQVQLGAGGIVLLHLLHQPAALPDDPASAGLFHTAILLPRRADLGRWLRHADATGVALDGAADHLVSEAAYLHDPEGNGVEVYADRPPAAWHWTGAAGSRRVDMANHPLDFRGLMEAADAPWTGAPAGTRIGHVHLRVGDLARAAAFYVDVLGLDVIRAASEAAFLSTGGYHHHVGVNVWRSPGAGPRDPARAGLAWVRMDAADSQLTAIARRSQATDLADAGLRDPWGTQIKITQRSPGEHRP